MSRMMKFALVAMFIANSANANDVGKYPAGQRPHHLPKSPQPVGILSHCFGYHATQWTPWFNACTPDSKAACVPAAAVQPRSIILYDAPESAKEAGKPSATPMPATTPPKR